MTQLQKLNSIRLCLSAHPDNEPNSEFADRISDLDELIQAQENADSILLDDFAKAAMQGELMNQSRENGYYTTAKEDLRFLAKRCYDMATAMMQERERRMKG